MWNLSRNALNVWYSSYSWYYEPIIMTSDHIWYLLATGTPCETHASLKKYMELITNNTQNANTVPKYAVEAT